MSKPTVSDLIEAAETWATAKAAAIEAEQAFRAMAALLTEPDEEPDIPVLRKRLAAVPAAVSTKVGRKSSAEIEALILGALKRGPQKPVDIMNATGITNGSFYRVIDKLVEKDKVIKDSIGEFALAS